jgi:hypothetical protein
MQNKWRNIILLLIYICSLRSDVALSYEYTQGRNSVLGYTRYCKGRSRSLTARDCKYISTIGEKLTWNRLWCMNSSNKGYKWGDKSLHTTA